MVINTNIEAQATANNLNASQLQLAKSLSRLSSGSKIIVPSDDAAGLAVSSRLNSQIKRLDSALNNVINAVSFTQTQDGFMKTIDKAFRRMGELAMLAQDTTKSNEDRALYNQEFAQLKSYVSETTKQDFNGVSLFAGKTLDVTVDADGTTFSMVGINLEDPTYTSSINNGTDAWKLTSDAYMLTKDGYKAKTAVYKTSVDMWVDSAGSWSKTDNGGNKILAESMIKDAAAVLVDTAAASHVKDSYVSGATVVNGFKSDYTTNKLNKTDHGLITGEAITFHSNIPSGLTAGTTYYVNSSDANNVTLHTTKAHATAGSNIVDLARTNVSTSVTGITTASGSANFTKTAHGLVVGDKVTVTKNAPTGLTLSQTYNVATVASANVFTLTGITDAGSASSTVEVSVDAKGGGSGTNTSNVITMTGHGFETGDQVRSGTTGGGLALNTAYYIQKVDADSFKIFTNSTLTTAKNLNADVSGTLRFELRETATNVSINDKGSVLSKGMYTAINPISTLMDKDAVLAVTGEIVNIAKTTQDISAFANELGPDYDDVNLKSVESAQIALTLVKEAITQVATDRAKLGAVQSRLNFTNEQLTVTKENLSAAISRIADVDVAEEATAYARYQILVQSGTEMLKQANQLPQSALQLLR